MSQFFEFSEELGSVNKGKLKKSKDRLQDLNGSNLVSFPSFGSSQSEAAKRQ